MCTAKQDGQNIIRVGDPNLKQTLEGKLRSGGGDSKVHMHLGKK